LDDRLLLPRPQVRRGRTKPKIPLAPKNFSFSKDEDDANFDRIHHELLSEENKREYLDSLYEIVTSVPKYHKTSQSSVASLATIQYGKDQKKLLSDFLLSPELEINYCGITESQVRLLYFLFFV
jgi:hypothetical protein